MNALILGSWALWLACISPLGVGKAQDYIPEKAPIAIFKSFRECVETLNQLDYVLNSDQESVTLQCKPNNA